jgi:hypothetical protein
MVSADSKLNWQKKMLEKGFLEREKKREKARERS